MPYFGPPPFGQVPGGGVPPGQVPGGPANLPLAGDGNFFQNNWQSILGAAAGAANAYGNYKNGQQNIAMSREELAERKRQYDEQFAYKQMGDRQRTPQQRVILEQLMARLGHGAPGSASPQAAAPMSRLERRINQPQFAPQPRSHDQTANGMPLLAAPQMEAGGADLMPRSQAPTSPTLTQQYGGGVNNPSTGANPAEQDGERQRRLLAMLGYNA